MTAEPRNTRQRQIVRAALDRAEGFLTAQQLHAELAGGGQRIGLATVYRNLQALADTGEVDSLRTPGGELAYRTCSQGHHHHLICKVCHKAVEVRGDDLEAWAQRVAAEHGYAQPEHRVEIYGICPDHAGDQPEG